jgi:hypothetical protein
VTTTTLHRDDVLTAVIAEARTVDVDVIGVEAHGHLIGVEGTNWALGRWAFHDLHDGAARHEVSVRIHTTGGAW